MEQNQLFKKPVFNLFIISEFDAKQNGEKLTIQERLYSMSGFDTKNHLSSGNR